MLSSFILDAIAILFRDKSSSRFVSCAGEHFVNANVHVILYACLDRLIRKSWQSESAVCWRTLLSFDLISC